MSSSNEYQAKEFVEDDLKEISNGRTNPSIHSLISSGLVVPKLSSSNQNNINNNDITSTLKERIASIKSKLGSEASWNEIIGKHFPSTSISNDTPHRYQKSIFELCSEVEILLLLMNSDRVSKLTETLTMMSKSSSTATHDTNRNTNNKVVSHLKKRLANVHVEIENTLAELTQKMQLIEPVFGDKFHNKYWEEESAQMTTTTNLLAKTIKEQSDALDTRMKENENKMMKAIDALKKRC